MRGAGRSAQRWIRIAAAALIAVGVVAGVVAEDGDEGAPAPSVAASDPAVDPFAAGAAEDPRERDRRLILAAVEELVNAADAQDPALCSRMASDTYMEDATGEGGHDAQAVCERAVRGHRPAELEGVEITRLGEERAEVVFTIRAQGTFPKKGFRLGLRKIRGRWMFDRVHEAKVL